MEIAGIIRHIITYLPPSSCLRSREVNRLWKNVITSSATLRLDLQKDRQIFAVLYCCNSLMLQRITQLTFGSSWFNYPNLRRLTNLQRVISTAYENSRDKFAVNCWPESLSSLTLSGKISPEHYPSSLTSLTFQHCAYVNASILPATLLSLTGGSYRRDTLQSAKFWSTIRSLQVEIYDSNFQFSANAADFSDCLHLENLTAASGSLFPSSLKSLQISNCISSPLDLQKLELTTLSLTASCFLKKEEWPPSLVSLIFTGETDGFPSSLRKLDYRGSLGYKVFLPSSLQKFSYSVKGTYYELNWRQVPNLRKLKIKEEDSSSAPLWIEVFSLPPLISSLNIFGACGKWPKLPLQALTISQSLPSVSLLQSLRDLSFSDWKDQLLSSTLPPLLRSLSCRGKGTLHFDKDLPFLKSLSSLCEEVTGTLPSSLTSLTLKGSFPKFLPITVRTLLTTVVFPCHQDIKIVEGTVFYSYQLSN